MTTYMTGTPLQLATEAKAPWGVQVNKTTQKVMFSSSTGNWSTPQAFFGRNVQKNDLPVLLIIERTSCNVGGVVLCCDAVTKTGSVTNCIPNRF